MSTDYYDDSIEIADELCPKCGHYTYMKDCAYCDPGDFGDLVGFSHHDCGEDCCACIDPEPNVMCDVCEGKGRYQWCPECGWDLIRNCYINNGKPKNEVAD